MPARIKLENLPISEIKDHFYNGMSQKNLAIKYFVSVPTMKNIIEELGLIRVGRIPQRKIDFVLLNKNYHIAKISKMSDLDPATVLRILRVNNILPAKRGIKSPPPIVKIKSRYEQFKDQFCVEYISLLLSKSLYHACISTGYSEVILKRYAQEYNISFKKAFTTIHDISSSDIEKIKSLYKENLYTNKEIQEMYSVGSRTFRKITKDIEKESNVVNIKFEEYKKIVRRLTTVVKNL